MIMRGFATKSTIANTKLIAPPMVYIMGEEHTRYAGKLLCLLFMLNYLV
jgi:hypothetical protein